MVHHITAKHGTLLNKSNTTIVHTGYNILLLQKLQLHQPLATPVPHLAMMVSRKSA